MYDRKRKFPVDPSSIPEAFDELDWEEDLPWMSNVASACECTGMTPRPPVNPSEEEAYRSLFSDQIQED